MEKHFVIHKVRLFTIELVKLIACYFIKLIHSHFEPLSNNCTFQQKSSNYIIGLQLVYNRVFASFVYKTKKPSR